MFTTFGRRLLAGVVLLLPLLAHAFQFVEGDLYASTGTSIQHYSAQGALLETLDINSGVEARGIAFGRRGALYVVRNNDFSTDQKPRIEVIGPRGRVQESYAFDGWIGGLATAGTLRFDPSGQVFYVAALDGVYRFVVGSGQGQKFIDTSTVGLTVLANGDLLVAQGSSLRRYNSAGALLSTVDSTLQDPLGLTTSAGGPPFLSDIRGIEYDPNSDTTFVTMLGYTGISFKVLALQGYTNVLKGITDYWYGAHMTMWGKDRLVVGSWTQAPGAFQVTRGSPLVLTPTSTLGGSPAMFVTVMPARR